MKLAWLAAAWIGGAASFAVFGSGAAPLALAVAAALGAAAFVRRDPAIAVYAVLLAIVFSLSLWRAETSQPQLSPDAAAHFNDGVHVRVRAVLRNDPEIRDTSRRFAVTVREIEVRGEWRQSSGGILVHTGLLPAYRAGDVLELEGRLQSPPEIEGFDYADYLAQRGIASVMGFPRARLVGHEEPHILRRATLATRRELSRGLGLALPEPQASLAQGVLLGQRSALPPDIRDALNTTNTSHLVVVSGSNVVYVASFIALLFTWLVGRRRALVLSIVAVLAYAMLVGADPPVVRATIMGILLVVARLSGRRTNGLTSILLAAALMIGVTPVVVRDVSFQLSFAATAGIIYLAAPMRSGIILALAWLFRRDEVPRWTAPAFAEPLAMTLAAVAATTPLIALNFGRLSLVGIPANILVVPAFALILFASLLAAIGGVVPHLHLVLATPAYFLLSYWLTIAETFAALPAADTSIKGYTSGWAIATYALLLAVLVVLRPLLRGATESRLAGTAAFDKRQVGIAGVVLVPAAMLVVSAGFIIWPAAPRHLEVTVLDVGQGDAILIETPSGHDILIDGGPGGAVVRALGAELSWRNRSIDLLVLTHADADHVTGLLDVLARYDVRRVIAPPNSSTSLAAREFERLVQVNGTSVEVVAAGTSIDLGDGVTLDVLAPGSAMTFDSKLNNGGLVLRLAWADVSFLFAADIEAAAEAALLAEGEPISSTVLKVPHHGSQTSSSPAFVEAVRPAIAVVSAGRDNRFGHPADEVVARLGRYADVYSTATHGSVRFKTDGLRLWVETRR